MKNFLDNDGDKKGRGRNATALKNQEGFI